MANAGSVAKTKERLPKKEAMTSWYNPLLLLQTVVRVGISTVFGQFADKREAIAASNAIEPETLDATFDYSRTKGELWLDFLADTGDGWNPTYAMARLATMPTLHPEGATSDLPRGRLLILGGDQVYPTASREAYDNRFLFPFDTAAAPYLGGKELLEPPQDLFAIPGNHDWYDGLNAFFGIFCRRRLDSKNPLSIARRGRVVAGRKTLQTRSYFAIELTKKWWLWGTDSQLEGYIDQPQIDYFRNAASNWMEKGSNLILCVGQPSWAYDASKPETNFASFSYLERLAGLAEGPKGEPKEHRLKLVLTGDSHHYSRFTEDDRTYITCGGGGAFLHPTHHLKNRSFPWRFPRPGEGENPSGYTRDFKIEKKPNGEEALFPNRATSAALTFKNLAFAFHNGWFTLFMAGAYALFLWVLNLTAHATLQSNLVTMLREGSFSHSVWNYWWLTLGSPGALLLIVLAASGYIYFAETDGAWRRFFKGLGHATIHAVIVTVVSCAVIRLDFFAGMPSIVPVAIAAALSAIVSASAFGAYLLINLRFWGRHWNEAFSSFAFQGYKGMLRMRITGDGALEIYPIGLRSVPSDDGKQTKIPDLKPELIEPPLKILP